MMVAPRWGAAGMGKVGWGVNLATDLHDHRWRQQQQEPGHTCLIRMMTSPGCGTGARRGRGHARELRRTHGLIGGAAACSRSADGDMLIWGCGLPLRHDECDPVATPAMAYE